MKNIRIFLASSGTLEKDRDEILIFLSTKNQFLTKHDIFLELVRWEFLSSSFSTTRKQDDFNKELVTTDIFICLVYDRIGQYTREEFETALQYHKMGTSIQKLYLYFKQLPKGKEQQFPDVCTFMKEIENQGQCYRIYKNIDQLKLLINQNLDQDLPNIMQKSIVESLQHTLLESKFVPLPEEVEIELNEADQMLDRNLTKEALQIYQKIIRTISKTNQSLVWSKLKSKIGRCYLQLGSWEDSEINRQKALLCFEDVFKNLDPKEHRKEYLQILHDLGEIKADISHYRDSKGNLKEALSYVQRQLALAPKEQYPLENRDALECIGQIKSLMAQYEKPKENLEEALHYLTDALTYYQPESNLKEYISTIYSISTSYWRLSSIENQDENLGKALANAEKAMPYVSIEKNPRLCKMIHNMMEVIYTHFGRKNKDSKAFKKALEHNEICISIRSKNRISAFDIVSLLNKGTILHNLYELEKDQHILEEATKTLKQVLPLADLKTYPRYFAFINQSLSRCYLASAELTNQTIDKKRGNLENALKSIQHCLSIFEKPSYPKDFSNSKSIEGDIHRIWGNMENREENEKLALEHYREALSVYEENLFQGNHDELMNKINSYQPSKP